MGILSTRLSPWSQVEYDKFSTNGRTYITVPN